MNASLYQEKSKVTLIEKESGYSSKGKLYGLYKLQLELPENTLGEDVEPFIININYLNTNQWNITNHKCVMDIHVEGNRVVSVDYIWKINKYGSKVVEQNETVTAANGEVNISCILI